MKNRWNCISCLGGLLLLVGIGFAGVFTTAFFYITIVLAQPFDGGWTIVHSLITSGVVMAFIGVICLYFQFSRVGKWNSLVRYANTQGEITFQEAGEKVGISAKKAKDIVYEAVSLGELSGTISGDSFTRGTPAVITRVSEQQLVLVVCPYCGAKTEQGKTNCQSCNAKI